MFEDSEDEEDEVPDDGTIYSEGAPGCCVGDTVIRRPCSATEFPLRLAGEDTTGEEDGDDDEDDDEDDEDDDDDDDDEDDEDEDDEGEEDEDDEGEEEEEDYDEEEEMDAEETDGGVESDVSRTRMAYGRLDELPRGSGRGERSEEEELELMLDDDEWLAGGGRPVAEGLLFADLLDDSLPALLDLEASAAAAAEGGGGTAAAVAPGGSGRGGGGDGGGGGGGGDGGGSSGDSGSGNGSGDSGGSGGSGAEGVPPPLSEQEWLHALTALDPRPCAELPLALDPSIRAEACARFAAMPRGLKTQSTWDVLLGCRLALTLRLTLRLALALALAPRPPPHALTTRVRPRPCPHPTFASTFAQATAGAAATGAAESPHCLSTARAAWRAGAGAALAPRRSRRDRPHAVAATYRRRTRATCRRRRHHLPHLRCLRHPRHPRHVHRRRAALGGGGGGGGVSGGGTRAQSRPRDARRDVHRPCAAASRAARRRGPRARLAPPPGPVPRRATDLALPPLRRGLLLRRAHARASSPRTPGRGT